MAEKGEARFSILYDGDAVADGTIDAKELAPALLAFADLVDEARALVPEAPDRITLRVHSGFERGSFEIHLELAKLYEQLVSMFSGQEASAWSNLFQIIGISITGAGSLAFGVFQLIKRARGRKAVSVTIEHTERVKVTFEGDEPIEVDKRVWALFKNRRAREAIERIIRPLKDRGIDRFKIRHKGRSAVDVKQDEAGYFDAPTEHEGETSSTADLRVQILAPSFQEGNKWRVSDGSRNMFVAIEDPDFARAVQKGEEAFRKGDVLQVTLQTRQWMEGSELKVAHSIVKVHGHENVPQQQRLPIFDDQRKG